MKKLTLDEARSIGSPMTSITVCTDGCVKDIANGNLLQELGIHWPSKWLGKSLHDVLEPHFTGKMNAERHKILFDEHIRNPREVLLRPVPMKSLDSDEELTAFIGFSEPREIMIPLQPGMPVAEKIEGITAFVLLRKNVDDRK